MARTKLLWAIWTDLVDRLVASCASAGLTSAAVRSLSFAAPIRAVSGVSTSRFVEIVFIDRPSSP
jgi:hypothetical protein